MRARVVVIGGGIAGLSTARALARDRDVTVLEQEAFVGTHSSARNAQIWLPVDDDPTTGPLARASAAAWAERLGGGWLRPRPAVVLTDAEGARRVEAGAAAGDLSVGVLDAAARRRLAPEVEGDDVAVEVRGAGTFEPSEMIDALRRDCRDAGVRLATSTRAERVEVRAGRVAGVALEGGARLAADEVVIAAGAYAGPLGAAVGAATTLVPLRRHLVVLEAPPTAAMVWRFTEGAEVYWRAESGGVLASPCDEDPVAPSLPAADPSALERLAERLASVAPSLVDAPVRKTWACLRTYARDRELVLGLDPRVEGLAWNAGHGGRGMTVGLAAGELCARALRGEDDPMLRLMRPHRDARDVRAAPEGARLG
ncbi:MAG: FAD-binding oxidoreductase [Sandaracinaceae bacterium]|nr:FAD-binding oxidoreductase [Sandaracinaceae bacterium]